MTFRWTPTPIATPRAHCVAARPRRWSQWRWQSPAVRVAQEAGKGPRASFSPFAGCPARPHTLARPGPCARVSDAPTAPLRATQRPRRPARLRTMRRRGRARPPRPAGARRRRRRQSRGLATAAPRAWLRARASWPQRRRGRSHSLQSPSPTRCVWRRSARRSWWRTVCQAVRRRPWMPALSPWRATWTSSLSRSRSHSPRRHRAAPRSRRCCLAARRRRCPRLCVTWRWRWRWRIRRVLWRLSRRQLARHWRRCALRRAGAARGGRLPAVSDRCAPPARRQTCSRRSSSPSRSRRPALR